MSKLSRLAVLLRNIHDDTIPEQPKGLLTGTYVEPSTLQLLPRCYYCNIVLMYHVLLLCLPLLYCLILRALFYLFRTVLDDLRHRHTLKDKKELLVGIPLMKLGTPAVPTRHTLKDKKNWVYRS